VAEAAHVPIFIMRNPGVKQLREVFAHMLGLAPLADETDPTPLRPVRAPARTAAEMSQAEIARALQEAEDAIHHVLHGKSSGGVELTPQGARIRRMQHLLAERYNLHSRSFGKEPKRRVYIYSAS
jgi:hypothetical protein